jgi:hypothetical protein
MNTVLWIVQVVLAGLFVFAGGAKLVMPIDKLAAAVPGMSGTFLRFIGVCELLGGLGLVLPGLLHIRPFLTPLAAALLVIVMIGATVTTLGIGTAMMAVLPLVTGILAAFVAYGRWRLVPLADSTRR